MQKANFPFIWDKAVKANQGSLGREIARVGMIRRLRSLSKGFEIEAINHHIPYRIGFETPIVNVGGVGVAGHVWYRKWCSVIRESLGSVGASEEK